MNHREIIHHAAILGALAVVSLGGGLAALLVGVVARRVSSFINTIPAAPHAHACPCVEQPIEGANGAYEEPDHVRLLRQGFVSRQEVERKRKLIFEASRKERAEAIAAKNGARR